ncbi:MAG: MBL fold metallo-hydrolase [Chloroflexales bacterium]|nr:MBL fold metallo-hydrolase [Chloroflexales bacterium]
MPVSPPIHALRIPFTLTVAPGRTLERFVYCHLIVGPSICVIDSGVRDTPQVIFDYLASIGRHPAEIQLLVLTHAHPDHIGGARTLQQATGCRIAAHPADVPWIEDVDQQVRERPVPGFHDLVAGPVAVDLPVVDGASLAVDSMTTLQVIHTPGHARGHIALFDATAGALFTGDSVPIPGDIPIYDDVAAAVRSVERLQALPRVQHLFSAWDAPRAGAEVAETFARGLASMRQVHEAVRAAQAQLQSDDPVVLAPQVGRQLGVPPLAISPLFVRTIAAHLQAPDLWRVG